MTTSATLPSSSPATSNRNLKLARWLRPFAIDVRALAAMRIGLGIIMLYDAITRFGLLRVFYTDDGASPRGVYLGGALKYQSLFSISGSYAWAVMLLTIHLVLALLFTIGYRTRIVSILLAASWWSLINRNPTLSHGGNTLVVWMLIWSICVPLNVVASADAFTARARPRGRRVASLGTLAMLLQLAFMYWGAFAVKTNADWRSDFSAVYYFLNSHLATPLGYVLGQSPLLTQILTVGSLALELFGPFFVLLTFSMPRTRTAIVVAFMLFHIGLVATMYVGTFSAICIVAWFIYLPTAVWDALSEKAIARSVIRGWNAFLASIARFVENMRLIPVRSISPGPQTQFGQGVIGVMLIYACIVNFVAYLPTPIARAAGPLARLPKLKQSWGMMDVPWRHFHLVSLQAELVDGSVHAIKSSDAPDGSFDLTLPVVEKPEEYWKWPVWRAQTTWLVAYRTSLFMGAIEKHPDSIIAYCDYHRRKWNQFHPQPSQQVKSVRAYAEIHATKGPGGAPNMAVQSGRQLLYTWPPSATANTAGR